MAPGAASAPPSTGGGSETDESGAVGGVARAAERNAAATRLDFRLKKHTRATLRSSPCSGVSKRRPGDDQMPRHRAPSTPTAPRASTPCPSGPASGLGDRRSGSFHVKPVAARTAGTPGKAGPQEFVLNTPASMSYRPAPVPTAPYAVGGCLPGAFHVKRSPTSRSADALVPGVSLRPQPQRHGLPTHGRPPSSARQALPGRHPGGCGDRGAPTCRSDERGPAERVDSIRPAVGLQVRDHDSGWHRDRALQRNPPATRMARTLQETAPPHLARSGPCAGTARSLTQRNRTAALGDRPVPRETSAARTRTTSRALPGRRSSSRRPRPSLPPGSRDRPRRTCAAPCAPARPPGRRCVP